MAKSEFEKMMVKKIEESLNNLQNVNISNKLKAEAIFENILNIEDDSQEKKQ